MKKSKNKKSEGFGFIYIFFILVFVAGITFLGLSLFLPKKSKNDDGMSTAVNETTKNSNPEIDEKNNGENPDKTPKQYEEGDDETDKTKINASITTNEINNGKYVLRVTMYELVNDGTCKLHMETSNGDTVDRNAKIEVIGPDSSSCDGFDIPTSGISPGSYNFTVTMTSGSKTGSVKGIIKI